MPGFPLLTLLQCSAILQLQTHKHRHYRTISIGKDGHSNKGASQAVHQHAPSGKQLFANSNGDLAQTMESPALMGYGSVDLDVTHRDEINVQEIRRLPDDCESDASYRFVYIM